MVHWVRKWEKRNEAEETVKYSLTTTFLIMHESSIPQRNFPCLDVLFVVAWN
jgi:hypothetical protein